MDSFTVKIFPNTDHSHGKTLLRGFCVNNLHTRNMPALLSRRSSSPARRPTSPALPKAGGAPSTSPARPKPGGAHPKPHFVIGAGFGRTGTLSTKLALQTLLQAPCYHFEVAHPDHIAAWRRRIYDNKPIDYAWLFKDYAATLDFPFCLYYNEMLEAFPDAKVLLTVRDPEKWYSSIRQMIALLRVVDWVAAFIPYGRRVMAVARYHFFGSSSGKFGGDMSRENAIRVYLEHIEEVKRRVPAERLLVFDCSKDGWPPLCAFLGAQLPPPGTPFPHLNDGMGTIKRLAWLHFWRLYARPTLKAAVRLAALLALVAWLCGLVASLPYSLGHSVT